MMGKIPVPLHTRVKVFMLILSVQMIATVIVGLYCQGGFYIHLTTLPYYIFTTLLFKGVILQYE